MGEKQTQLAGRIFFLQWRDPAEKAGESWLDLLLVQAENLTVLETCT